ncbi:SRPBCC family protein [Dinghuibacter silviterrae]|uniref:Uncharacterized protein YndB with AHSA1/START domain n=1 Tax=Dinghuibacter silviterrae TaxID=1539049 RepID=A0A4V3GLK9_9BACT|nr:SRPBCC family protein [Dinghuibacter silviterrae]TDW99972.1 uncharacterized protein YndB with AHSA1/START domain [Dinghuibacter silviterrae]
MAFPLGQVLQRDGHYTLRFERQLEHPVSRVWDALTQPAYLAKWIAEARVDLQPGGEFILDYTHSPKVMRGTITRLKEYALLEYTWDEGPDQEASLVCWELLPQGPNACLLVLTHSRLTRQVPGLGAGWHTHIDLMAEVLDGSRLDFSWNDEWWKSKLPDYGG